MLNHEKDNLSILFSDEVQGPFVTFILNTHVAHQDVEKDSLAFKILLKMLRFASRKSIRSYLGHPFKRRLTDYLPMPLFGEMQRKVSPLLLVKRIFLSIA
ncbi:hypothetical protein A5880_000430 [Enterococcus sp. 4G2_DIV0659]|uniref:Uncharacterized protein n=1 Tax=Candidatus Enterococcus mansonii TaxID=1834181 RepID=A0ABU8IBP8_9ENTE